MRALLTVVLLAAATALGSGDAFAAPTDQIALDEDVASLGLWGPLAIVVLRATAAIFAVVPSSPVVLAAGATEGLAWGAIYVLIGAQLGALIGFFIGRFLGRDFVVRRGWMAAIAKTRWGSWLLDDESSQGRLMAAVFYCRLIPGINLDAMSYVAGVTPIATWRFCVATLAGLIPYTLLLVAIGQQLVSLGATELLIFLALVLGLAAMPVIWRLLRLGSLNSAISLRRARASEPGDTSPRRLARGHAASRGADRACGRRHNPQ
jgi:uncharacterized membrane protein YdjX (TVP38/TMEM64 family)